VKMLRRRKKFEPRNKKSCLECRFKFASLHNS
jgi:hypothetical protein